MILNTKLFCEHSLRLLIKKDKSLLQLKKNIEQMIKRTIS